MATLKSSIEPSDGATIENPSEEQILSILNKFGRGVEHCNFTYGDSFVSAHGSSPEKVHLMYIGPNGTEYNSDAVDAPTVCKVFMDSREGDTGWKEMFGFVAGSEPSGQTPEADAEAGADPCSAEALGAAPGSDEAVGTAEGASGKEKKSLKDEMLNAVKSEAAYNAKRMVRRGMRGLFGKKF